MYQITAGFSYTCLVLLLETVSFLSSTDIVNISYRPLSNSHSNISADVVRNVLAETTNLSETNLHFLYGSEYEDVVQNLSEPLSEALIGQMRYENDGKIESLRQLLVLSPRPILLVVLERPQNIIRIFEKIRIKLLHSHIVKWLAIMEEESGGNSISEIEEFVSEGTHLTICRINPSGLCDLFFPYVDNRGNTRFVNKTAMKKRERLLAKSSLKYPSLSGREMIVGTMPLLVFAVLGPPLPDNRVEYVSGLDWQVIRTLSNKFNFTYQAYLPPDRQWGNLQPDGNVTGIIGLTARRNVTFSMSALVFSETRESVVDFAWFDVNLRTIIVSRSPKEKSKSLAILFPFQIEVWACIIMTVLCMGPVAYLFSYLINGYEGKVEIDFLSYEFNMFRSIVNQGILIKRPSGPLRIILTFWLLFSVIYTATYSGMLTAMLAIPAYETPIDYLEDLPDAVKRGYTIGILSGSSYEQFFKTSSDGIYKQTWKLFNHEDRSQSFMPSHMAGGKKVIRSDKFVYIVADLFGRTYQRQYGAKNIHLSKETFNPLVVGIACQTGSPLKDIFFNELNRMQEAGLIMKWLADEFRKIPPEQSYNNEGVRNITITLTHLEAAFYLLVLGLSLATITLLIERLTFTK